MVEDDFHNAVDPAVETVVQVRGLVQCRVVGDDLAGPGAPADDQVPQVRGVPAIVGAPESDCNALVEQRCPGHVQRPVGMASVRGGRRVGGGEHAGDAQPPRRIDQPGQVIDDLTGILPIGMSAVAGLEADSVDSRHHPAHLLRSRQGGAGAGPAELGNLLDRVSLADVDRNKSHLPGLVEPLIDQVTTLTSASQYEGYLMLGFGASGKELAEKWDITDAGPETINGVKTEKLDLVAKDPTVRKNLPKVTIWVDLDRGVSLKQVFDEGQGQSRTCTYSNIKINESLPGDAFTIKTDSKTQYINR